MGIRNNAKWLTFDLAYSDAIKSPHFIDAAADEDYEVYFSVSARKGF